MSSSTPDSVLQGLAVLVVESDPRAATALESVLTRAGCRVRLARSAEGAREAFEVFPARAVVLDLVLPRMNGLVFARQLKDTPATRDLVIIAMSALDGGEARRLALEAGCADYLHRLLDLATLPDTLAHHVARAAGAPGSWHHPASRGQQS